MNQRWSFDADRRVSTLDLSLRDESVAKNDETDRRNPISIDSVVFFAQSLIFCYWSDIFPCHNFTVSQLSSDREEITMAPGDRYVAKYALAKHTDARLEQFRGDV